MNSIPKKIIVQARPFAFPPCGLRTYVTNFIQSLARQLPNISFELLVPERLNEEEFELPSNCTFVPLFPPTTEPEYLSTILWENQLVTDYVNTTDHENTLFYFSPYHCLPYEKLPVPEIILIHDVTIWKDPDPSWSVERRFSYRLKELSIANAKHLFTVSSFTKNEVVSFFKIDDSNITPIFADINPYYKVGHTPSVNLLEKYGLQSDEYFLYIGSYEKRKNVDNLLKAYEIYQTTSNKKKKLVVVGFHTEKSKEVQSFNETEKHANIVILPQLAISDLYTLYKSASAFVYPSHYEGFGLQILEAQWVGTPLLVSDIPVFREVAQDGALFFNQYDPNDIARKMLYFENTPDIAQTLIQRGHENAKRFDWKNTVSLFTTSLSHLKLL